MLFTQAIEFDTANILTAVGVAVGLLSALYALRSAREARRQAEAAESSLKETRAQSVLARAALSESKSQNRISTHSHRLDAYKALLDFQGAVTRNGVRFPKQATWALFDYARMAEFYFSAEVAMALTSLVDIAIEVQVSREAWGEGAELQAGERARLVEKLTH